MFAIAAFPAGWMSSTLKRALNSGSSKQGKARRASAGNGMRSWRLSVFYSPPQFIKPRYGLKKSVPGTQREILKGITLAFYPTAKIGVLGPNGGGKSTLPRIMAGVDKEYVGDARITEGYRAGLLAQEPQLDAGKDVRGNVAAGV